MTLCTCPGRPRCEWKWCEDGADWSVWRKRWADRPEGPAFMCGMHFLLYRDAMKNPIRGIDRPPNASEDWRPSLSDMMRHAEISIAFEKRNDRNIPVRPSASRAGDERFTSAQLQQMTILRKYLRDLAQPNGDRGSSA